MSLVNSISAEWRALTPNIPTTMMDSGNLFPILELSSKQIYQIFLGKNKFHPVPNKN